MRVIVAVTGASGAVYAVRLLEVLRQARVETHLIVSRWGAQTLREEMGLEPEQLRDMAAHVYAPDDLTAPVASGSFPVDGMVVVPCSMKTVAAIAHGFSGDLITRAADVCLKERRHLIILPRETPLSSIHLENLLRLARLGVVVMPPAPAFYIRPASVSDLVDHTVGRILDHLGVSHGLSRRWRAESADACPFPAPFTPALTAHGKAEPEGPGEDVTGNRLGQWEAWAGEGRFRVCARAWGTDDGYVIGLFGGDRPHVGTVVVSIPRPSLAEPGRYSSTSSVISLPAHKEEEVIRPLGEELARVTRSPVVGVAGVHLEGADPAAIEALVQNCREAGKRLLVLLGREGGLRR